ncbi:hypothetical protein [Ferribacterium limneticum]|uniref:hypothetical protein n=1 Tax=Ferribacterium limneticum TaxID=76259 RepID=UPI001CF90F7B|nr:hypothetical protein [Ferribacterium limneticum]UCV26740.1 hypothetical protein KI617_10505 [Ferribacterium limneticum]UCV30657.1 hypothetical protein KI608_10505 [Ferribacterium limneticum]
MKLYQKISNLLAARENCIKQGNLTWQTNHTEEIEKLVKNTMPSGSGFDAGTVLDLHTSKPNKLIFSTGFHHMDEHGGYDGWTHHQVVVTPNLQWDFDLRITGPNRNEIKDYIHDQFQNCLSWEVPRE